MIFFENDERRFAGTGHRLEVLGAMDMDTQNKVTRYTRSVLPSYKPEKVISGMALGFDIALAEASLQENIYLILAIPFEGQESHWPDGKLKDKYQEILKSANEVHIISEGGYSYDKYLTRDRWMVDNSNHVIALWNGHPKGGTAYTVKYANKVKRNEYNVWPGWENFEIDYEDRSNRPF